MSLIPIPICVYLSLLEVGTWLGESWAKISVENLVKTAPDDAPDAPLVRPVWWVCRSALTGPAHSVLSASVRCIQWFTKVCPEAPDASPASGGHCPVTVRFENLFVF